MVQAWQLEQTLFGPYTYVKKLRQAARYSLALFIICEIYEMRRSLLTSPHPGF
jgi:hypothetical protein